MEATLRVGSLVRRLLMAPMPLVAVAGPDGRILLRPWGLNANKYIAPGFDQLRQVVPAANSTDPANHSCRRRMTP